MDELSLDALRQQERISKLEGNGDDVWTIVYQSHEHENRDETYFGATLSDSATSQAMDHSGFDADLGSGGPGMGLSYDEGRRRFEYIRNGDDGIEPLVILQDEHHPRTLMPPQLAEEFRLFHNLWVSPSGHELIKIEDDGTETAAAIIIATQAIVRTRLIRQYQAARQRTYGTYVDSRIWVDGKLTATEEAGLNRSIRSGSLRYDLSASSGLAGMDRSFTRLLGKRLIAPPPLEKMGLWPFEPSTQFHEFIIDEDEYGQPIRHTCDPEKLGNYFGKNPDAPHFLTPVYFSRSVLQRYYDLPEKYEVVDGHLSCRHRWGIDIDNDHPDQVMVFLGDLGRLPESERGHWITHNIVPTRQPSETAVRRAFLGQFVSPEAPDLRFRHIYEQFGQRWNEKNGWELFRQPHPKDAHVLQRLRVPVNTSQPEFEQQILALTQVLIDSLNEKQLRLLTPELPSDSRGITKFEAWLEASEYPHIERDIAFLRRLQRLRSKISTHRKGADFEEFLEEEGVDDDPRRELSSLLNDAIVMLDGLGTHFGLEMGKTFE